tara:strand:- start:159 stop:335 length:177 start_codon:yes stop_codon:yes gene_type:complete
MKFLLSVIAVCLVMITAKLYIPQVYAESVVLTPEEILQLVDDNCQVYANSYDSLRCKV